MAPLESKMPFNSSDGFFGLFKNPKSPSASNNIYSCSEFDTFKNDWDLSDDRVGISINSIFSVKIALWKNIFSNWLWANSWVSYNSSIKNLSVFLTYADNPVFNGNSSISYLVGLRDILPEWVRIGFFSSGG